ncbi:MAG: protease inhibitor I42 family protein [Verrucomicrobiae bacterium]|nr:protease inhibitor I42 family protein [Verrucomicrobiae bacterium]
MKPRLSLATIAVLLLTSCAAPQTRFTDSSQPIEVVGGQSFEIVLESNPTTGYSWTLAKRLVNRVVTLAGNEYRPKDSSLTGASGLEIWTFVARHEGATTISLAYRRPWEKEQTPAKVCTFRVVVRKG